MHKGEHGEPGKDDFVLVQRDSEVSTQMVCPFLKELEEIDSSKPRKWPEVCLEVLSLNHNLGNIF